jgi:hypothetical protein
VVKHNKNTNVKVFPSTVEFRMARENGGEGIRIGIEGIHVPEAYNEDQNISEYDIALMKPYFEDIDV